MDLEIESFYLENTQTGNKFWQGILVGRTFIGIWGAIGSVGQSKVWNHKTKTSARKAFEKKRNEKMEKGYVDAVDPMSEIDLKDKVESMLRRQTYDIVWTATGISSEEIEQAALESEELLTDIGRPLGARIVHENDRSRVYFLSHIVHAHFGFPPMETEPDEQYMSKGGWLNNAGQGIGTIESDRGAVDLAVRVFLIRLGALTQGHLSAEDSLGNELEARLTIPPFGCDWEEHLPVIHQAFRDRGWLPGSVSLPKDSVSIEGTDLVIETGW